MICLFYTGIIQQIIQLVCARYSTNERRIGVYNRLYNGCIMVFCLQKCIMAKKLKKGIFQGVRPIL